MLLTNAIKETHWDVVLFLVLNMCLKMILTPLTYPVSLYT